MPGQGHPGIANAVASRGVQAPTLSFTSNAEIEGGYLSPLLIETNAARRKLCAAVETIFALLVIVPADRILALAALAPCRLLRGLLGPDGVGGGAVRGGPDLYGQHPQG
jgi:hypothetical protein